MTGRVINAETGEEIHEEPDPQAWVVPDGVLGFGVLEKTSKTERRGPVTMLVRGTHDAVMTLGAKVNDQWTATLRIGRDECAMLFFPPTIAGLLRDDDVDEPATWHGVIRVQDYDMTARVDPVTGALRLLDRKQ